MTETDDLHKARRGVFRIVLAYAFFAGLWILLSDRAMGLLLSDPKTLVQASMVKGWLFVATTSLLLYVLVGRLVGQIAAAHQRELELARELQRVPAMLSALADNTDDAIFVKDLEGRYLLFNNAAARIVGKPAEAVLGQDDRALFTPEEAAMLMAIGRRVIETGKTETNEEDLRTADGTKVFLATKGPIRDAKGKVFGIFGISRDITERKRANLALRESEDRLARFFDNAASLVWIKDLQGRFVKANSYTLNLLGRSATDVIGHTVAEIFPQEEADAYAANDRRVIASGTQHNFEEIAKFADGLRTFLSIKFPLTGQDGKIYGIGAICTDITEKKQAEQELRNAQQQIRALFNTIPDLIWLKDVEGRYLTCNHRFEQFFGATEAAILGKTDYDFVPRELADLFRANDRAAIQASGPSMNEEEVTFASDGHHEILQTIKTPFFGRKGQLLGVLGISRDISDRRQAEDDLRQRNAELERFNKATVGREIVMIEMKKTINALSRELGRREPHDLSFVANVEGRKP